MKQVHKTAIGIRVRGLLGKSHTVQIHGGRVRIAPAQYALPYFTLSLKVAKSYAFTFSNPGKEQLKIDHLFLLTAEPGGPEMMRCGPETISAAAGPPHTEPQFDDGWVWFGPLSALPFTDLKSKLASIGSSRLPVTVPGSRKIVL